ncbi:hypothetical protein RB653_001423 [Dictyostelium firmibasis]|uniref:Uncharacterized protein n=1 Tax=Dictyostelium firmibasis TaxID=79012 RepID=A0AAN7YWM6_9MYCE
MEDIDRIELSYELLNSLIGLNPFNGEIKSGIFSGFWGKLFSLDDTNYLTPKGFNKIFYGFVQDIEQLINEKTNEDIIIFLNKHLMDLQDNGNSLCDLLKIWEMRNVGSENIKSIITNFNSKSIKFQEFSKLSNYNLKLNIRNYHSKLIILLKEFNEFYFQFFSTTSSVSSTFLKQIIKLSTINMSIYSSITIDYINNGNQWEFDFLFDLNKKKELLNEFNYEILKFQNNFGYSLSQLIFNTKDYNIYKIKSINNTLKTVSRFNEIHYLNYKYPIKIISANKRKDENILIIDQENSNTNHNNNKFNYIYKIQPKSLIINNKDVEIKKEKNNFLQEELIDIVSGLYPFFSSNSINSFLKTSICLKGEESFYQISFSIHCSNDLKLNEININNNSGSNITDIEKELSFSILINSSFSKTNQTNLFLEKVDLKKLEMETLNNEVIYRNSLGIKNKMYYGIKKFNINPGFQMDKIIFEIKDIKGDIVIDNIEISFDQTSSFPTC